MSKTNNWPDDKLISALSKGGALREQAVDRLMRTYINYVPTVARKAGISKELALDAFTDSLIAITQQVKSGKFKGESKLSSYLYKIFYYKAVDLFRKNTTNRIDYGMELPEVSDTNPIAAKNMETNEDVKQLYRYLDRLGEPCKQILLDWGFWGYNMTEIAERVGLEGSTQAKDKKYKCLQNLRKLMK